MTLGEAPVHLEQIAGPQRRLLTAGAGADLDDDVLALAGILRDEQLLEPAVELLDALIETVGLLREEARHLRIALLLGELPRFLGLRARRLEVPIGDDDLLELREPAAEVAEAVGIAGNVGRGHLRGHPLVVLLDVVETGLDPGRHASYRRRTLGRRPSVSRSGVPRRNRRRGTRGPGCRPCAS